MVIRALLLLLTFPLTSALAQQTVGCPGGLENALNTRRTVQFQKKLIATNVYQITPVWSVANCYMTIAGRNLIPMLESTNVTTKLNSDGTWTVDIGNSLNNQILMEYQFSYQTKLENGAPFPTNGSHLNNTILQYKSIFENEVIYGKWNQITGVIGIHSKVSFYLEKAVKTQPTPQPTATPYPTATPTPYPTATPTPYPTATPTPYPTSTPVPPTDSKPTIKLEGIPAGPTSDDFTLSVNITTSAKLKSAQIYIDNNRVYNTVFSAPTHAGLAFLRTISVSGLQNGVHQLTVIASDYNGQQAYQSKSFAIYRDTGNDDDSSDDNKNDDGEDTGDNTGNDSDNDTDTSNDTSDDTGDNDIESNTSEDDSSSTESNILESLLINLSELLNELLVILNNSSSDTEKKAVTTGLIDASAQMIYQVSKLMVAIDSNNLTKSASMSQRLIDANTLSSEFAEMMKEHKSELQSLDPKLRRMPRLTRRLAGFTGKLLRVKKPKRKQKVLKKVKRTVRKIKRLSNERD